MEKNRGFSLIITLILVSLLLSLVLIIVVNRNAAIIKQEQAKRALPGVNINDIKEYGRSEYDAFALITETQSDGKIKVTNRIYGYEFTIPASYTLSGNANSTSVYFEGDKAGTGETPGPRDMSVLLFGHQEVKKSLVEIVRADLRHVREFDDVPLDYNEIRERSIGNVTGYTFSAPFLVEQESIYLPLKRTPDKYLYITKSCSDDYRRGYKAELDAVLSSMVFYE